MDASPAAEREAAGGAGDCMDGRRGKAGRAISASIFRRIKRARSGSGPMEGGYKISKKTFQLVHLYH